MSNALLAFLFLAGCGAAESSATGTEASDDSAAAQEEKGSPVQKSEPDSNVKPAPDFTLPNLDGDPVSLSSYRGKIVVLEWFNPECPFVKLAHSRELSLKGMAAKWSAEGITWLGINSAAPGMQGHGGELNEKGSQALGIANPILLDEDGTVGKAYDATRTPQMIIIDPSGNIVYSGAIDNTLGGDPEDAEPGPAANYVTPILAKLMAKETVPYQETKPWGCSVKYAK